MASTVFHFIDVCRMFGVAQALRLSSRWAIRREFFVFQWDLRIPLPTLPSVESSRWTHLTAADIPHVQMLNPALGEAEVRRRLGEGQDCLLCWIGESLVHYMWHTTKPAYLSYLGKTFWPLDGDVFVVDSFTQPAFRRRGIQNCSINRTACEARESGFSRRLSMVPSWNTASLRALGKNGCAKVGRVGYWNTGLRRFYFASGDVHLNRAGVSVRPMTVQVMADEDQRIIAPEG